MRLRLHLQAHLPRLHREWHHLPLHLPKAVIDHLVMTIRGTAIEIGTAIVTATIGILIGIGILRVMIESKSKHSAIDTFSLPSSVIGEGTGIVHDHLEGDGFKIVVQDT